MILAGYANVCQCNPAPNPSWPDSNFGLYSLPHSTELILKASIFVALNNLLKPIPECGTSKISLNSLTPLIMGLPPHSRITESEELIKCTLTGSGVKQTNPKLIFQ